MSYATPDDLMARYDIRRLGDLTEDDGTRSDDTSLETSGVLQAMLDDASGMVNSAALIGGRYTVADLSGLAGTDAAFLKRIVCDLAFGLLNERRAYPEERSVGYERALALLDRIRDGKAIFSVRAVIDASQPKNVVMDANRTLVASARRFFGSLALDPSEPRPKGF